MVLCATIWIFHRSGPSEANIDLPGSAAREAQMQTHAKPMLSDVNAKLLGDQTKQTATPLHGFRRVRVGPNEVDYVSDDVTIRTFEPMHTKPQVRAGAKEVNFGNDVTVRYFAKLPTASPSASVSDVKPGKN